MKIFSVFLVSFFLFSVLGIHENCSTCINKNPINYKSQLLRRYLKYGKRLKTGKNSLIYEYVKDSVSYKMLIQDNEIIYSSSEHIFSEARAWAKFNNNCIVFYDTIDGHGKILKSYERGYPLNDNQEYLSSELKEFYCK